MNPSETAARVNKGFQLGHAEYDVGNAVPAADALEAIYARAARAEREVAALANHPSDEVNRRYIVPLQVAYASAMAQRDRLLIALEKAAATLEDARRVFTVFGKFVAAEAMNIAAVETRAAILAATKPSP